MIVVDASVVLEALLQTSAAARISQRILTPGITLHAPHFLDVEIAQALRRYAHTRVISSDRGAETWADLTDLPVDRYPLLVLLPRIWELRHILTAYDAAYLALAEALDVPLLRRDVAFKAAGAGAHVELI